jgi:hypothetical protein
MKLDVWSFHEGLLNLVITPMPKGVSHSLADGRRTWPPSTSAWCIAFNKFQADARKDNRAITLVTVTIEDGVYEFAVANMAEPRSGWAIQNNSMLSEFFERCPAARTKVVNLHPDIADATRTLVYIRQEDLMFLRMLYA